MDLQKFDVPRYLATLPLFSNATALDLQRLARTGCHLQRFARGQLIFRAGQECHEFHVTVLGQVKLFAVSPTGAEKVIDLCGPGHSFGEGVMFKGAPYAVSAQALDETLLLTIRKDAVIVLMRSDFDFVLRMLAGMSRRLYGLVQDVKGYTLQSGMQRIIGYLLGEQMSERSRARAQPALQEVDGDDGGAQAVVVLPASKAAVASRLSLTPEYFSRALGRLREAGLIEVQRRTIRIMDVERLAGYREPGAHG